MLLFDQFDLSPFNGKFKHSDQIVRHELSRNRATREIRESCRAKGDILFCLNGGELVFSAFRLDGDYVLSALPIDPCVNFIDLDLADCFHGRPQMIL